MKSLGTSRAPVGAGAILAVGLGLVLGGLWQPGANAAQAGLFPNLSLSPSTGPAGAPVTVSGSLRVSPVMAPSEPVRIYFDGALVGRTATDWYGRFSTTIVVPANARPGLHLIQAMGRQDHRPLWAPFRVAPTVVGPPVASRQAASGSVAS